MYGTGKLELFLSIRFVHPERLRLFLNGGTRWLPRVYYTQMLRVNLDFVTKKLNIKTTSDSVELPLSKSKHHLGLLHLIKLSGLNYLKCILKQWSLNSLCHTGALMNWEKCTESYLEELTSTGKSILTDNTTSSVWLLCSWNAERR
jgi:hypothetical protein